MGYLTVTSETGFFHAVCLLEIGQHTQAWYGFKPKQHRSPYGPGHIDTSNREENINHYARFEVKDVTLKAAIKKIVEGKYKNTEYVGSVVDCVTFAADMAGACGLKLPYIPYAYVLPGLLSFVVARALLPGELVAKLALFNRYVALDKKPYPWRSTGKKAPVKK